MRNSECGIAAIRKAERLDNKVSYKSCAGKFKHFCEFIDFSVDYVYNSVMNKHESPNKSVMKETYGTTDFR